MSTPLPTWRRDVLLKMYQHIEEVTGMPWFLAICRQFHLSEYILYGVFVEHVLKKENSGHFFTDVNPAHEYFPERALDRQGLEQFIAEIKPEHQLVMITAKGHMSVDDYEDLILKIPAA